MTFEDYLLEIIKEVYCEEQLSLKNEDLTPIYERILNKPEIEYYRHEWIIEQRKNKLEKICGKKNI